MPQKGMAVLFNLKKGNIMLSNSEMQQLKEAEEKQLARIKTVLKFGCLFVFCLMVLAPLLEALLSQIKGVAP